MACAADAPATFFGTMPERPDETFHRLHFWTGAAGHAEGLAAAVVAADGYEHVDPIHPRGGPDRKKDALLTRDGELWIMAVYFPYGDHDFAEIQRKFVSDFAGVAKNGAKGMAFVTNQSITEGQRAALKTAVDGPVDIFHVDRVAALLDGPTMSHARSRFLTLPAPDDVPHRNMREVFDGPTSSPAPDRLTSIYAGMFMLGVAARPAPDLLRHPAASRPLDALETAAERAAQAPKASWPKNFQLLNRSLAEGWQAGPGHNVWSAGWMPTSAEQLESRPHARAVVRLRDFTAHVQRTWLTTTLDDRGQFAFHAARDPEVVAEILVALGLFHGLLETAGVREVDVAVHLRSSEPTVSSRLVVSGGRFGEVAGRVRNPAANVPTYYEDVVRVDVDELADPLSVAEMLIGAWQTQFRRDDDLIARLRER